MCLPLFVEGWPPFADPLGKSWFKAYSGIATAKFLLRWRIEIGHDPTYCIPWEERYYSIPRSAGFLVSRVGSGFRASGARSCCFQGLGLLGVGFRARV